jgi:hypothetical protein
MNDGYVYNRERTQIYIIEKCDRNQIFFLIIADIVVELPVVHVLIK